MSSRRGKKTYERISCHKFAVKWFTAHPRILKNVSRASF
jgi:hypothetical protein